MEETALINKQPTFMDKVKSKAKALWNAAVYKKNLIAAWITMSLLTMSAYAADSNFSICTSYTICESASTMNPEGLIIGLATWICRLVGLGMLIWGIYGYVTARKDGEAEAMNGAIGKLISGVVLIAMPNLLSALGIINLN